jgi:NAD(P)-dependent dehydrogenase (short-subunit alcohol dehydrogenase family)
MPIRFDDRVVIITGAGRGLGRAYAHAFARLGGRVVVNDPGAAVDGSGRSAATAESVAEEIRSAGGMAIADTGSVTEAEAVAALVARALSAFGRIDVLVNNAGILRDRSFGKMSDADWDDVLAVHLDGSARMSRAVWPIMRAQAYGRIVMATSSTGLYGNFGQANYGAAKLGLVGLMNTLKIEGERYGIRVNAVAPVAATRMTEAVFPPGTEALLAPERVAAAVLFLASADAPSGAILAAGGGAFASARIEETVPVYLGMEAGPDAVAENWGRISDFSTARPIDNSGAQTVAFLDRAVAGAPRSND